MCLLLNNWLKRIGDGWKKSIMTASVLSSKARWTAPGSIDVVVVTTHARDKISITSWYQRNDHTTSKKIYLCDPLSDNHEGQWLLISLLYN
jgi:hypothetical protein